jgi:hypothetical protein
LFGIFEDLHRHFIIALERLCGIGPKGLHAAGDIGLTRALIGFEVEPTWFGVANKAIDRFENRQ